MRIAGVLITSASREHLIGEAIRSLLPHVDKVIVIFMAFHPIQDDTLGEAERVAGDRLSVVRVEEFKPFHEMRNLSLSIPAELGYDWCIQLDTDERILTGDLDLRELLAKVPEDLIAINIRDLGGSSERTRIFRLPPACVYNMEIHEDLKLSRGSIGRIAGLRLAEEGKGHPNRQDDDGVAKMRLQMAEEPENNRWPFYLARMLDVRGELDEAIELYRSLYGSPQSSFCAYRCAACLLRKGLLNEAVFECFAGLPYDPGYAELLWLASALYIDLGNRQMADACAGMAMVHTWVGKSENDINIQNMHDMRAYYDGPLDVKAAIHGGEFIEMAKRAKAERIAMWGDRP